MAIIGIVAVAKNNAIGKGGKLPWHYPADLKFFKQTTIGNAVVMGMNTWRSIGRPLPNRLNIVNCDMYVIGGSKTFAEFSEYIQRWTVTEIPLDVADADTFMPADFLHGFNVVGASDIDDGLRVSVYEKVS